MTRERRLKIQDDRCLTEGFRNDDESSCVVSPRQEKSKDGVKDRSLGGRHVPDLTLLPRYRFYRRWWLGPGSKDRDSCLTLSRVDTNFTETDGWITCPVSHSVCQIQLCPVTVPHPRPRPVSTQTRERGVPTLRVLSGDSRSQKNTHDLPTPHGLYCVHRGLTPRTV